MIRTRILAVGAAAMVAAATLGLSAAPAAAEPYGTYHGQNGNWNQGGNGNWHGNNGWKGGWQGHGHRVCKPVVRSVKVQGYHGWHWKSIVVGERCYWTHW